MYTNNQNCGCNMNNYPQNMDYGYNNNPNYNNNGSSNNGCGPTMTYQMVPNVNTGCICDPKAIDAGKKMNEQLIALNALTVVPEKIHKTFSLANQLADNLSQDSFAAYNPDPDSLYSNFQQFGLAAVRVNDYYDRAIEQLMIAYDCCKKMQDQNSSCWYTTKLDCQPYLDKVVSLKADANTKKALLEQTILSTINLANSVSQAEATVTAAVIGVNQPLNFVLALLDEKLNYLTQSFRLKYSAYTCCKSDTTDCCNNVNMCDCQNMITQSHDLETNVADLTLTIQQQQDLLTANMTALLDAENKDVTSRQYLYSAMAQIADISDQINTIWQNAYDTALQAVNCCMASNHSGSCCSPNCESFVMRAIELQKFAQEQRQIVVDTETRMTALIALYKSYKDQEQQYLKDMQTMTNDYLTATNALTDTIINEALPMMTDAYSCCSHV